MILFAGAPGRVVAIPDAAVVGVLPPLVTPNPGITFSGRKSIITRIAVSQRGSFQFLHTLGGDIYIYVFGDRIGNMQLSGLSFAQDCTQPSATELQDNSDEVQATTAQVGAGGDDGQHGIEKMIAYYKSNRISSRSDPVTILLGKQTTLTAFITGSDADVADAKTYLVQWSLELAVVPD
jgi:hypothetical protein